MKINVQVPSWIGVYLFCAAACASGAEKLDPIQLVKPELTGGKPLMQALAERKSLRSFSDKKLRPQLLSNLLWAAFGINRLESGKRTAPSAVNWQEIDLYAATERGLFLYNARAHRLDPVLAKDIRSSAGEQPFVRVAPLVLIFVADYAKMGEAPQDKKDFYSATDTGFISQNVYLFCASEGLATVVLGMVDRPALAKVMGLRGDQKIVLTQPVGYPK
ncbi:MAG: SagB/ThcOx family dehydrogenase [Candidatus Aureabacteria bacterium]|nr:SagB/ThcOx family dehydrogenase [Candidatus Auribacterota bacterium]